MDPIEIPLRRKYLTARRSPYRFNGDHQGNKRRHKIGYDKIARLCECEPPVRIMLLTSKGHRRMITVRRTSYGPHPSWGF